MTHDHKVAGSSPAIATKFFKLVIRCLSVVGGRVIIPRLPILKMVVFTFEFCKSLKANGFPQPKAETGQIWYNIAGNPVKILPNGKTKNLETGKVLEFSGYISEGCIYHPDFYNESIRLYTERHDTDTAGRPSKG